MYEEQHSWIGIGLLLGVILTTVPFIMARRLGTSNDPLPVARIPVGSYRILDAPRYDFLVERTDGRRLWIKFPTNQKHLGLDRIINVVSEDGEIDVTDSSG